jgi:hypothetical protein
MGNEIWSDPYARPLPKSGKERGTQVKTKPSEYGAGHPPKLNTYLVILSGVAGSRSEAATESKDACTPKPGRSVSGSYPR